MRAGEGSQPQHHMASRKIVAQFAYSWALQEAAHSVKLLLSSLSSFSHTQGKLTVIAKQPYKQSDHHKDPRQSKLAPL